MFAPRKLLSLLFGFTILTAIVLLYASPADAQITKGCSGINYLGAEPSNPFTAEHVTTSTMPVSSGPPNTIVRRENVARDSQGRIRFEKHGVSQPPDDQKTVALETPDGKPFTVTREEYGTVIEIFDCASGTFIRIQPGMRIAAVKESSNTAPVPHSKHAYSAPYFPPPGAKTLPNVTQEELGTREIQGVSSRGIKTTIMGTEQDGDWNGKPLREDELGLSDDLAAQVLSIRKDLKTGNEDRSELLAIRRKEPDPALFEIPKDFEVNPARMSTTKDLGVARPRPQ